MSTATPKPAVVPPTESLAKMTVDVKAPQNVAPSSVSNSAALKAPGCKA
jgi:hypothetical protein